MIIELREDCTNVKEIKCLPEEKDFQDKGWIESSISGVGTLTFQSTGILT
jgi:hypothetical protein